MEGGVYKNEGHRGEFLLVRKGHAPAANYEYVVGNTRGVRGRGGEGRGGRGKSQQPLTRIPPPTSKIQKITTEDKNNNNA